MQLAWHGADLPGPIVQKRGLSFKTLHAPRAIVAENRTSRGRNHDRDIGNPPAPRRRAAMHAPPGFGTASPARPPRGPASGRRA